MEDLRDPDQAERRAVVAHGKMKLRIPMCVAAMAVALGLTAAVLGHLGAASATAMVAPLTTSSTNSPDTALPPIRHVFVIVLENESAAKTFPTSGAAPAPYLADTMTSEGALLPNYYGTGHESNDNYIAMISGQAPNPDNSTDCQTFGNFATDTTSRTPYDEQEGAGCVYPSDIPNLGSQLDAAGDSWRDYNEDMGNDPTRESGECGHPAVGSQDHTQSEVNGDAYATRHDPFVYFHDIIDDTTLCDSHVVNLDQLQSDLSSAATTPDYTFITPNLCHDGHDATCDTPGENGGFTGIDDFLSKYVPMITGSAAFRDQNGLLITTFDEASTSDASSCCGELPGPTDPLPGLTGSGGGRVGAVLISPCIAPGTVSDVAYNHYSMLGSVENLFSLRHLGYAALPGENDFGSDIYTRRCDASPPALSLTHAALRPAGSGPRTIVPLRFSPGPAGVSNGVTSELQVRRLRSTVATAWKTVLSATRATSYAYTAASGDTYQFRVRSTNGLGLSSPWTVETTVIPSVARPTGATLGGHWVYRAEAGAWRAHAEFGSTGATYSFPYNGGALKLLATKLPAGGHIRVRFDGVTRVISVHATDRKVRQIVFSTGARIGHHTLRLTVLSGTLAVESLVVSRLG